VAQDPLHLELVGVSGANQYNVKPLELTSTCFPPIVLASSVVPEPELDDAEPPAAAGVPVAGADEVLAELPQAASASAIAASPVAPHMCRIWKSP
jgi:hypothetical protein